MPELSHPHYAKLTAFSVLSWKPWSRRRTKYFLICEFLDMTPVSIISTQIDDVLIVRKAKRMSSNIRQEYRTPEERRFHRKEYVDFLDSSKYYPDVFQRMIDKIQALIDDTSPSTEKVLMRGHF